MKLITPAFWKSKTIISYALLPFSLIYLILFYIKKTLTKKHKLPSTIITIGNLTAGGGGKTVIALKINELLKKDYNTCFLTRGYKGNFNCTTLINEKHTVAQTGDEAQILSKYADTIIAKKRYKAKAIIEKFNKNITIMDDGLQHFSIYQDIKILAIDSDFLFGNNFIIPAGPLRQIKSPLLKKVDYIFYIGKKKLPKPLIKYKNKIITASYAAITKPNPQKKYFAFSGLANNQKFFNSLQNLNIVKYKNFPDHHNYKKEEIVKLLKIAKKDNLLLITTSKDIVKIKALEIKEIDSIIEFQIALKIDDEQIFVTNLNNKIKNEKTKKL